MGGSMQAAVHGMCYAPLQIMTLWTYADTGHLQGNLAEMKGQLTHKETMETMRRANLTAEQVNDIEDEINGMKHIYFYTAYYNLCHLAICKIWTVNPDY